MDTICEWYGWHWAYAEPGETPSGLNLAYGLKDSGGVAFEIPTPFSINEIGKPQSVAEWDEFSGVPNPCKKDPIAGIFYLLTCSEEYTIRQKDEHQRVRANDLSVVQNGYASIPLADRLAEVLAKAIWQAARIDGMPKMEKETGYSSLDVDQVYAVRHKPVYKQLGNLFRSTLGHGSAAGMAIAKAIAGGKDPFDEFDWIKLQHESRGLQPFLFMLMGYENKLDPAWKPEHKAWLSFIDGLKGWATLGIHPSYHSSTNGNLMLEEKKHLEKLTGEPVYRSRQHYLKLEWPKTFEALVGAGISEDYSLAWPDCLGFRMGTARSCFWYNLSEDEKTTLRLYPPVAMEVTGRFYQKLSPKQFLESTIELAKQAELSNSGLRIIWHNSNLSAVSGWAEWKEIYLRILDLVALQT